jgi:xanthine dehydrogenase accessory factor
MQGYWENLQKLVSGGRPFVAVTLVDVVASAPANVGSKMLVTDQGLIHGTVGGGKIEMKALAEAKGMLAGNLKHETRTSKPEAEFENVAHEIREPRHEATAASRFVEWNLQKDVGMTCGGVVRLYFEAYNVASWPIVIFGAGHCSQALVRLLLTMQCHLTVIDPREEWLARLPGEGKESGKLRVVRAEGSGAMAGYVNDLPANAFVLMMTMGHATDQPILVEILKTRKRGELPYVGVIGSEAKAAVLRKGILAAGVAEEELSRYCCPIGLPIGTNDPAEIAISVAAQLLQKRDATRATARV